MTKNLFKYSYLIQQIPTKQYSQAIILLSVLELFDKHNYQNPQTHLNPRLVATCIKNWDQLMVHPDPLVFTSTIFALQNLGIWHLVPKQGLERLLQQPHLIQHVHDLDIALDHMVLSEGLFQLIKDKESRQSLIKLLLNTFFPETQSLYYRSNNIKEQLKGIQQTLLESDTHTYCALYPDLPLLQQYLHQSLSTRLILKYYQYTCCISGLSVPSHARTGLVKACTIRQYPRTKDYTIRNGLCLTPTLYQAFSKGLFCIDQQYKVRLSNKLAKYPQNDRWLKLEGKALLLPAKENRYPSLEHLAWHEEHIFSNEQRNGRRARG